MLETAIDVISTLEARDLNHVAVGIIGRMYSPWHYDSL